MSSVTHSFPHSHIQHLHVEHSRLKYFPIERSHIELFLHLLHIDRLP